MSDPAASALARGEALLALGRHEEAAEAFRAAAAVEPEWLEPRCQLALAYLQAGRSGEGLEAASDAAALAPEDEWPQRLRALAFIRLDRPRDAVAAATEAARMAPEESITHQVLGDARLAAGDPKGARRRRGGTAAGPRSRRPVRDARGHLHGGGAQLGGRPALPRGAGDRPRGRHGDQQPRGGDPGARGRRGGPRPLRARRAPGPALQDSASEPGPDLAPLRQRRLAAGHLLPRRAGRPAPRERQHPRDRDRAAAGARRAVGVLRAAPAPPRRRAEPGRAPAAGGPAVVAADGDHELAAVVLARALDRLLPLRPADLPELRGRGAQRQRAGLAATTW